MPSTAAPTPPAPAPAVPRDREPTGPQPVVPPLVDRVPGTPPPGPPAAPAPAPDPRSATPEPVPPAPAAAAAPTADATRARQDLARWRISVDTGESFVVEGLVLLGRRPEARAGEPAAQLVPLRSEDMSLSKTHAQVDVVPDGALVVMDRGSTNGSVVVRRGLSKPLSADRPTTLLEHDQVRLGDRTMTVTRDAAPRG